MEKNNNKKNEQQLEPRKNKPRKKGLDLLIEEFGQKRVYEEIENLVGKSKDAVKLFYGIETGKPLTYREVNELVGTKNSHTLVAQSLKTIRKRITTPKAAKKEYVKKEIGPRAKMKQLINDYGVNKVVEAIDELADYSKDIMCKYFGLYGEAMTSKQIEQEYGVPRVQQLIYISMQRIESLVTGESVTHIHRHKFAEFKKSYGEQRMLAEIKKLPVHEYVVISMYFGINGYDETNYPEIAYILDMDVKSLPRIVGKYIYKVERKINNLENLGVNKRFKELKEIYGDKLIKQAILRTKPYDAYVARLHLGLDGNKPLSYAEIKEQYALQDVYTAMTAFMKDLTKALADISNEKALAELRQSRLVSITKSDNITDIELKLQNEADLDRKVMCAHFGLDGEGAKPIKEITKQYNISKKKAQKIILSIAKKIKEENINKNSR